MRTLVAQEKGDRDPWDLKLARGGLLDVEFVAQISASPSRARRRASSTFQPGERSTRPAARGLPNRVMSKRFSMLTGSTPTRPVHAAPIRARSIPIEPPPASSAGSGLVGLPRLRGFRRRARGREDAGAGGLRSGGEDVNLVGATGSVRLLPAPQSTPSASPQWTRPPRRRPDRGGNGVGTPRRPPALSVIDAGQVETVAVECQKRLECAHRRTFLLRPENRSADDWRRRNPMPDPVCMEPPPWKNLAGITFARRRDVGMSKHALGRNPPTRDNVSRKRDCRCDLGLGIRRRAAVMAGINDLDPNRGRV